MVYDYQIEQLKDKISDNENGIENLKYELEKRISLLEEKMATIFHGFEEDKCINCLGTFREDPRYPSKYCPCCGVKF